MESSTVKLKERQSYLEEYLNAFIDNRKKYSRVNCCGSSKSLYCTECHKLLIPKSEWPAHSLVHGNLQLPFDLDIILNDRRKSATGFHAVVLLKASNSSTVSDLRLGPVASINSEGSTENQQDEQDSDRNNGYSKDDETYCRKAHHYSSIDEIGHEEQSDYSSVAKTNGNNEMSFQSRKKVRLFSIGSKNTRSKQKKDENEEMNLEEDITMEGRLGQKQGTFLLFPSEDSIPLSKVASEITKLVVLDCKWTQTFAMRKLPEFVNVQKVHLDASPTDSFFWRWHNAGPGMLSTLEAIYFAALEVADYKKNDAFTHDNREALIDLMWLFGIQRAATSNSMETHGRPVPFSEAGKDLQRALRRTEKGSEKHIRDIMNGRKLRDATI